ncbi:MAG: PAS domain S-box protein, partial [Alphaproteobacteria bacterium]|nr:PAS domain S-box protein [Alphaproteobacteria bacterium]
MESIKAGISKGEPSAAAWSRLRRLILGLAVAAVFSAIGIGVWDTVRARAESLRHAIEQTERGLNAVEGLIDHLFGDVDAALIALVDDLSAWRPIGAIEIERLLTNRAGHLPALAGVVLIDAERRVTGRSGDAGRVFADAALDAVFRAHAENPDIGLMIGTKTKSVVGSAFLVPVSRQVFAPGGAFGGVLVALIEASYLESFFAYLARAGDAFALHHQDGQVVARFPAPEIVTGAAPSPSEIRFRRDAVGGGRFENFHFSTNGTIRLGAWRALERWPLVVMASRDQAEILRDWRDEALRRWSVFAVATAVIAILAFLVYREARRSDFAESELAAKSRRLDIALDAMAQGFAVYDAEARLVIGNRRYAELYGLPDELLRPGTPLRRIMEWSVAAGNYAPDVAGDVVEARLARFAAAMAEARIVRLADGRSIEHYRRPLPEGGEVSIFTDVTERERAATALAESRELLQAIVEGAPVLLVLKDLDLRYRLVNRRAAEWSRLKPEDMVGRTGSEIFGPSALRSEELDREVLATGRSSELIETAPIQGPESAVWLMQKVPVRDRTGRVIGVVSASIDITDRKRAETALLASEAKFRRLLEESHIAIVIHRDFKPVFANQAYAGIFGFATTQDVLASADLLAAHLPEKRDLLRLDRARRLAAGERSWAEEHEVQTVAGRRFWINTHISIIEWDGQPATLSFVTDVTARRLAESLAEESRRLVQAVIDALPAGVTVKDKDLRYRLANRYALAANEVAGDVIGKSMDEAGFAPVNEIMAAEDRDVLSSGRARPYAERAVTYPSGRTMTWWYTKVPLLDAQGEATGVITVSLDITDLKVSQREVERTRSLLQQVIDQTPASISVKG